MTSDRRFFSGDSLAQALNQAAQHFQLLPSEIAYKVVDKKHGFLKVRRKVVIEVDGAHPRGATSDEPPRGQQPETSPEPARPAAASSEVASAEPAAKPHPAERRGRPRRQAPAEPPAEETLGGSREGAPREAGHGTPPGGRHEAPGEAEHATPTEGWLEAPAEAERATPTEGRPEAPAEAERTTPTDPRPEPTALSSGDARPPAASESRSMLDPQLYEQDYEPGRTSASRAAEGVELPEAPPPAKARIPEARGEEARAAADALARILDLGDLDLESEVLQGDEGLQIELWGNDQDILLRDRGRLLLAIQHLLPRAIRGLIGRSVPCKVDSDEFHMIREERLRDMAQRAADDVRRRGRPKTLEPMSPDERRIVHLTLADYPGVETESHGSGLFKRVMVRAIRGKKADGPDRPGRHDKR